MITYEQVKYALRYAPDPALWVFEYIRDLETANETLIKYGTKVTVFQEHWRPVSEIPHVDENGNSKVLFAVDKFGCLERVYYHEEPERNLGYWVVSRDYNLPELVFDTKWWCYPPKEDDDKGRD
jgi:hypothetical protein